MMHMLRTKVSRFLGLGDIGALRAQVDRTDRLVMEINHNVLELVRRFDEMRSDLEAISAVSLGLERTSAEIAAQLRNAGAAGETLGVGTGVAFATTAATAAAN